MTAPQQKKLKIKGPVSITANRLGDGAVIWLTAHEEWSERMADAAVATDPDGALALLRAAEADSDLAVGPYVARVAPDAQGRARPFDLRERIRSEGPTFALPGAA